MPAPVGIGIYSPDSVSEVAQSLPIDNLGVGAADLLAGDVEYRLNLILQEAKKFMIHGKRTTLQPQDIEYAMEVLNVEPILVPPRPLPQPPFAAIPLPTAPATSGGGSSSQSQPQLYHVPDDEIDFATYLKQPLPAGLANSAGVKWKAHWLAVEGVQPAIPDNPAPSSRAGPSRSRNMPTTGNAALKAGAKAHLPQELQLYFGRLTAALVVPPEAAKPPSDDQPLSDAERQRLAALASLRGDQAVSGILVYLVKWVVESVQKCLTSPTGVLACLLDAMEALLDNDTLFIEPYLHQLLPPLMSILLTVPLGPHPPSSYPGQPSSYEVRVRASEVLRKICDTYGPKYPGLLPRLLSTLAQALNSDPFPSPLGASFPPAGRYEGAVLGLGALGGPAVRTAIWGDNPSQRLLRLDDLAVRLYPGEGKKSRTGLMKACIKALGTMIRPKPTDEGFQPPTTKSEVIAEIFGSNFARALEKRPWQASEMMRMYREMEQGVMDVDGN